MSAKQDRQGVRTATDLERKYQFDKQFAEVMGVSVDTQMSVSRIESELHDELLEQITSLTRDTEAFMVSALESYVETQDLEEFRKTIKAELEVWAEGILGRVESAESDILSVDADLQEKYNTIVKYFAFTIDGLTIGQADNPNKVVIDNDEVTIYVSGVPILTFKADGSGLIPVLKVTQMFNALGLQITEDETHINCDYIV